MESLYQFLTSLHTAEGIETIIRTGGLITLIFIVFAETGLLVGFFLPGDSLLVTAGILSSKSMNGSGPLLDFYLLNLCLMLAAIIGDQVGFLIGRKTGPKIFNRPDNRFFKKKYATEAHRFYEKHGGKAIVLARFIPILRTFTPFIAGVADMPYRKFVLFNIIGGCSWVLSMTALGHFIGKSSLGEKIHWVILVVIFISVLPMIAGILKKIGFFRKIQGVLSNLFN